LHNRAGQMFQHVRPFNAHAIRSVYCHIECRYVQVLLYDTLPCYAGTVHSPESTDTRFWSRRQPVKSLNTPRLKCKQHHHCLKYQQFCRYDHPLGQLIAGRPNNQFWYQPSHGFFWRNGQLKADNFNTSNPLPGTIRRHSNGNK